MKSEVGTHQRKSAQGIAAHAALISLVLSASSQLALADGDPSTIRFSDGSGASGLMYTQIHGPAPKYPNLLAGGAAGDFNNDGFADVFVLGNGGVADAMFINNGDGTFTDRAAAWGLAQLQYAFGASTADFNNDGYLDLFITSYGSVAGGIRPGQMKLLRNNGPDGKGGWSFTDVAPEAGVNFIHSTATDGTGSAWGDIDLDGDLDLFVGGYSVHWQVNRMFRNDGPDTDGVWRFTDITYDAGLVHDRWSTFVPGFVDLSGDGYPDLLAISDHGSGVYWVNNQDGTFTNRNDLARPTANGMGLDFGDVNNDGLIDYYATSIAWDASGPGNDLMVQQTDGSFDNLSHPTGCFAGYWGWGAVMADLDHDRDIDIVETNGFGNSTGTSSPAVVFENNGDGSAFTEVAEACGLEHTLNGRGLIKLDGDNDGDLDIVIFASGEQLSYFRNDLISEGSPRTGEDHWVRVVLGTRANDALAPQGIGSVVYAYADGREYMLPMHSGSSHCSSSPIEVHAGLGASSMLDALRVVWADGSQTTMTDIAADQILRIEARAHAADLDGSGAVDFADVSVFVTGFFAGDLNTDFAADWTLDIFDVLAFIQRYNEGIDR